MDLELCSPVQRGFCIFLHPVISNAMQDTIQVLDKKFVKYISAAQIHDAICKVAEQINEDYKNDNPIILITLNGAVFFAVDLLKQLRIPCRITCVKLSSYSGMQSTNRVQNLIGLTEDLKGQRVLVIEDIIDTGRTYSHIAEILRDTGMSDMRIATLTYKPDAYKLDLPIHYVGLSIPNKFIVGYGLDYDGYGRNYSDIYQVIE